LPSPAAEQDPAGPTTMFIVLFILIAVLLLYSLLA
jgi:hypothetical protein